MPAPAVVTREVVRQVPVTVAPSATAGYVSYVEAPPGTLLYPLPGDVRSVDPQEAGSEASLLVTSQLYEDLLYQQRDGSLAPAAATGYRATSNGLVYTVTLRSGLTWSTGQPISAADYVTGTCRLLAPAMGNPRKALLTEAAGLAGAAQFASGAEPDCRRVGLSALDAHTLQFTLERPLPSFPQLLARHLFLPAPPTESLASMVEPQASRAIAVTPPSSGPYLLGDWVPEQRVTLVKNPSYWDAGRVNIDRIEMPVLPNATDQLATYKAGQLHVAHVPAQAIPQAQADPALAPELHLLPLPGTSYLGINAALTPTSDIHLRQALAAALDPQALLAGMLHEPWHRAALRLTPPGLPGAVQPAATVAVSRTRAAPALLVLAGFTAATSPPVVTLWANREGHNQDLAEGIADVLEKSGIRVRLVLSGWDVYHATLEACRQGGPDVTADCGYNLYLAGWLMDSVDRAGMLGPAGATWPATAYSRWPDKEYAGLIERAQDEADPARRAALYDQAEQRLLEQAVVVPLFHYDRVVAVKPGITYDFPEFDPPVFKYWQLVR